MSQPQIVINPDEARRIEKNIILREIYYRPTGYYSNPKFLRNACKKEGHQFSLQAVKEWLNQQESYQIYKYPSKHVSRFSYGRITRPNCVHQCDILALFNSRSDRIDRKKVTNQIKVTIEYDHIIKNEYGWSLARVTAVTLVYQNRSGANTYFRGSI